MVDDQLRVKGLTGLRVIDASIMPTMLSANLNAGVMMIADKASDMILGKPALAPIVDRDYRVKCAGLGDQSPGHLASVAGPRQGRRLPGPRELKSALPFASAAFFNGAAPRRSETAARHR